jgi:transcriptional regulator with XRE-family HTH domain
MQLGERIRRLREKKHWSQAELAARLEIEPEELARWESGQDVPDLQQLDRLAALFSVPVTVRKGLRPFLTEGLQSARA